MSRRNFNACPTMGCMFSPISRFLHVDKWWPGNANLSGAPLGQPYIDKARPFTPPESPQLLFWTSTTPCIYMVMWPTYTIHYPFTHWLTIWHQKPPAPFWGFKKGFMDADGIEAIPSCHIYPVVNVNKKLWIHTFSSWVNQLFRLGPFFS
jgi:hypothetical protein